MDLNALGAVQVKIVVKLRGQHIAYRDYTRAQTNKSATSFTAPIYSMAKHYIQLLLIKK